MTDALLQVSGLKKYFPASGGIFSELFGRRLRIHAVDEISFSIHSSETFGLVGESGCGKSTTGLLILKLIEPDAGRIIYGGRDLSMLAGKSLRNMRKHIQIVFQNPYASLDPRWTVKRIISEPLLTHRIVAKHRVHEKVADLLKAVNLEADHMYRFPHQFSGGQRQRIGIARALAVNPGLLVADEPVSALDVSVQAQILNLIQDLREQFQLSILFISHDLNVVKYLSHRVGVMYMGKLVEVALVDELFEHPAHPYTKALLSAIPVASLHKKKERTILEGDIPSPINPEPLCRFRTRCPKFHARCSEVEPQQIHIGNDHFVVCHLASETKQSVGR